MLSSKGFDLWADNYDSSVNMSEESKTYPFAGYKDVMLEIAKNKMPKATLIKHDFTYGMPESLKNKQFDFIICTYAIHHLKDEQKFAFVSELLGCLSPGGKILMGDVVFETKAECDRCKDENMEIWDDEEIYPTLEAFCVVFPNVSFEKKSFCSGVFSFEK